MSITSNATRFIVNHLLSQRIDGVLLLSTVDYHRKIRIPESIKYRRVWLFSPKSSLGEIDYLTARRIVNRHPGFDYNIRENKRPDKALRFLQSVVPIVVAAGVLIGIVSAAFPKVNKPVNALQDAAEGKKK